MSETYDPRPWLRDDYCNCHEGYKGRKLIDPQCESCQTKEERTAAADLIDRLTAENKRLAEVAAAEMKLREGNFDTITRLEDERDRLAAALREIKPLTASMSFDLWQKCERIIDAALAGTAEPDIAGPVKSPGLPCAKCAELEAIIERWKVEELRQIQCQCTQPHPIMVGETQWCTACDKPTEWEAVYKTLRPDEKALFDRAAAPGVGT